MRKSFVSIRNVKYANNKENSCNVLNNSKRTVREKPIIEAISDMTDNHIILGDSKQIRRVVSVEDTIKGGLCRSCGQTLNVGEPRVKVAYPNVIVQYSNRTGSPSFFMHPACYESNPVDFWRIGHAAWKETVPIKGFALDLDKDVPGLDRFPQVRERFRHSHELYLKAQESTDSTESSASSVGSIPDCAKLCQVHPINSPPTVTNVQQDADSNCAEQSHVDIPTVQDIPFPWPENNTSTAVVSRQMDDAKESAVRSDLSCLKLPLKRKAEKIAARLTAPCPQRTDAADDEENDFRRAQMHKYHEAEMRMLFEEGSQNNNSEAAPSPSDSISDLLRRLKTCCDCACHIPPAERQWASPHDTAEILGISTALLRSLAYARAIPVFVRPSGQRVYNIPSVRKYMAEHTLPPL